MGHVFISYSSRHRDLTRSFAARLEAEGYPVWWDRELEAWGGYEPQIREALGTASAVVVIWSPRAAASDYVRAEVRAALRLGRLVNLRAPEFPVDEVPLDFRENHMLPLDLDDMGPILKTLRTVWEGRVPQGQTPAHVTYAEDYGEDLFDPRRRPLPEDAAIVTPSVLLQAPFEVAGYVDATGILADLMDWCRGTGAHAETTRPTAGRLLYGPGGLGKTRTMIEAVRRLRAEGWLAGFLPTPTPGDLPRMKLRHRALEQAMAATDRPGTLMVCDYAEARGMEVIELARMARRHDRAGLPPLRIVLMSRGDGWWHDIYRTETEVQIVFNRRGASHGDVIAVASLPPGESRLEVFDAMREALTPKLAAQAEAGRFPILSDQTLSPDRRARLAEAPAYARPLALQMEALLSLTGESGGAIADLLDSILGLERRHWRRVIEGLTPGDRHETALRRGMSQITALGGVADQRGLRRLLQADGYFGARAPVDLPLADLRRLYGAVPAGVAALEPDLIGEHEILLSGDEDLIDACRAWIASLPEPDRSPRRRTLLTVLQRAARAEHGARAAEAEAFLSHLLTDLPVDEVPDLIGVAIETPGPLTRLLYDAVPQLSTEVIDAVSQALPEQTVALAVLADRVADVRLQIARLKAGVEGSTDEDEAVIARHLYSRGVTSARLGQWEVALAAAEEALTIIRDIADARPSEFEPDIAGCQKNRAVWLSILGRKEEALFAAEEAVAIYRRLVARRPDEFEAVLAGSVDNLGIMLSKLGRSEEAIAATEEAVAINRRLAAARPDAYDPVLVKSLNNLGIPLSNLGRDEEALLATEEAVTVYRRLTAARPDAFEPEMALSLNNLSVWLSSLGRREEALAATEEALTIRRSLAANHPEAFEPYLSQSLTNLGMCLYNLERHQDALVATEEAVAIRRRLAADRPDTFAPDLAQSLSNLASILLALDLSAKSMAVVEDATSLLEPYARRFPAAHQSLMDALTATLAKARAAGIDPGDTP